MSFLLFYTFFLHTIVLVIADKEDCDKAGQISSNGMGTVLFTAADEFKQCWSPDEIATLTARMIMEDLLPDVSILKIDSNSYVEDIVGYFRLLIEVVKKSTHGRKKRISLLVLTDILGGYLQFAVLPIARHAFYSGIIDFNSIEKLIQLFEEVKWFLRTNGQGWSKPMESPVEFEIEQIDFENEAPKRNCCTQLIFYEYEHRIKQDNKTIVKCDIAYPMPFFDTNVRPSSIAVPFKKYALRNIESRRASYFLLKFFITAWQCLEERSSHQEAKQKFQNSFYAWLVKDVIPKTKDDKFYSAFGGVFRIEETLKALGAVTHVETTCAPEGDEEMMIPGAGTHKSFMSKIVLIVMMIIIFIWFVIGTAFICFRMKKKKKKDDSNKKSDYTKMDDRWPMYSKTDSKTESSIGICKCSSRSTPYSSSITSEYDNDDRGKKKRGKHSRDKTVTICYPPFMVPYMESDRPAVIEARSTMKKLPSIEEMTEGTSRRNDNRSSHHRSRGDESGYSKTSEERSRRKKQLSPNDTSIPCKHYPPTSGSSSRRLSWESIRKKIRPGATIDECWCDVLQEEEEEEEEIVNDSDKTGKPNKKLSVEFSLENIPIKGSTTKRGGKNRSYIPESGGSSRMHTGEDSNAADSQKEGARTIPSTGYENSPRSPRSPRSAPTVLESTDETSGITDKEGTSPHAYACHSSLTGAYAKGKEPGKPYIFGYDFQSSTSSDLSDEETDAKTPTSK